MDIYFHAAYIYGGGDELSAGTPLSLHMIYALTLSIAHTVAPSCGLLVSDAVEKSGKMWASHTFRYCPCIWLEGKRENVMNTENEGLQSQICTLCLLNLEECYLLSSSVWLFAFQFVFLKLDFQSLHLQTDAHNMITNYISFK